MSEPKKVVLLGATGSIGESALRVLRAHPDRLQLVGLSAHSNADGLFAIAEEFGVENLCLSGNVSEVPSAPNNADLLRGSSGLEELAALPEADVILIAVVGSAGLLPTLTAIQGGNDVILANKEALVVGGKFVMEAAREAGVRIIPADSEHNAVFQCLQGVPDRDVDRIILTASGGPFRELSLEQMASVTSEQALAHPNWSMGPKITVDSATMANKGLELIEAHWLFGLPAERLDVVIHPPSLVHSLVRLVDGCVLAQLTPPSMTFALQHAMLYPDRATGVDEPLDFSEPLDLSFAPPDLQRFPCLRLAHEAMQTEGIAPTVFNAANEIAVDAFLRNRIGFLGIPAIIEATLNDTQHRDPKNIEEVLAADSEARKLALEKLRNELH